MPIDQSKLGQHIQAQMEAIEEDPNISDNAVIGDIVTIVEIHDPGPGDSPGEGEQVQISRSVRYRHTGLPHAAIGLMTEARHLALSN